MALEQFRVGQLINGIDFGNVSNGDTSDAMDAFVSNVDMEDQSSQILVYSEAGLYLARMTFNSVSMLMAAYEELDGTDVNAILYATDNGEFNGIQFVKGYNNVTGGKHLFGRNYTVTSANAAQGWNGVLIGAVETQPTFTPIQVGDSVPKLGFDISMTKEQVVGVLSTLTYDEDGICNLIEDENTGNDETGHAILLATYDSEESSYGLFVGTTLDPQSGDISYEFGAVFNSTDGWLNTLTDGEIQIGIQPTPIVTSLNQTAGWNGFLVGFEGGVAPVDTVTAGTYSAATGIWTDNADYELTDDGAGTYAVTGLIPYGRADSLFDFAGHRFAVKISRDTITSRNDLPSGNIVVVTVGTEVSQYTKDAFETDGSLIYIAAPTAETLTTPRVVKIAWSIAGETLQESDFTSYTFDLSDAELAPIPQEDEDESRVAYCITPKITSDKFVKVVAPSGGLRAGQVVNCVALASSVEGVPLNLEVYSPSLPTNATLDSRFYALIVNGGFENLADGRRPSGNPDYTTYVYNEGDVCQGILLDKNLVFQISGSCISGDTSIDPTADIGRYIVPTNGTYIPSIANAPTDGGCLKIIGTAQFRKGGIFNDAFVSTYIAIAIH